MMIDPEGREQGGKRGTALFAVQHPENTASSRLLATLGFDYTDVETL